jgi:hypothetical protein
MAHNAMQMRPMTASVGKEHGGVRKRRRSQENRKRGDQREALADQFAKKREHGHTAQRRDHAHGARCRDPV